METKQSHTYSQIIAPEIYNRIITVEHIYIADSDQIIKDFIKREIRDKEPIEVVDLGCGPARMLPLMGQIEGINLTGIDHDITFYEYAKKVINAEGLDVKLILDNVEDYQHPKQVDVFFSQGFHHHVERDETLKKYLENIFTQLKKGGAYIVSDEFLPEYKEEGERQIRAIIWYAHVIYNALAAGYTELAIEEAKTLLDDLAEGLEEGGVKSNEQINVLLNQVTTINSLATTGKLSEAESLAEKLLTSLRNIPKVKIYDDPTIDLSRGDYKICHSVFKQQVESVGFQIESVKSIGPINHIGAMSIYICRK